MTPSSSFSLSCSSIPSRSSSPSSPSSSPLPSGSSSYTFLTFPFNSFFFLSFSPMDSSSSPSPSSSPSSSAPKPIDSVSFERCLSLLENDTTDEEKFAGLLLVTKILEPTDFKSLRILFSRMSFQFLRRLLASSKDPLLWGPNKATRSLIMSSFSSFSFQRFFRGFDCRLACWALAGHCHARRVTLLDR